MKTIVVISAHPDDEILGVGGTLIRHRDNGDRIVWIIVTKLIGTDVLSVDFNRKRDTEISEVSKELTAEVYCLDYPTMRLDTSHVSEMIPKISTIFNEVKPERIYVMNRSDAHSDHRIVFEAVAACTKSFRYPYIRDVLMYECISETEFAPALQERAFIPNYFVDISSQLNEKIKLMEIYESELGKHPFPRSIENITALAKFRGATAGVFYAEAFQSIKSIRIEDI